MNFFGIVLRSVRQHLLSTFLAVISTALGVALLVTVFSLSVQTEKNFKSTGLGVDAIIGPKGSALQIVLAAIYNLEDTPGTVKWSFLEELKNSDIVTEVVPFIKGHSFGGFHVNAIIPEFFTKFEYMPGKKFQFNAEGGSGRCFEKPHEAVAGYAAAKRLDIRLGDSFNPTCGIKSGVTHKDELTFVGIMGRTGTPYDQAIYMPLETFYTLDGHGDKAQNMLLDLEHRTVSGAFIKIRRIRDGKILHPGIQTLKYEINQNKEVQLVVPSEVLPRLFAILGWVVDVLFGISLAVIVLSALFLFISLYWALRERKRNIALMRALGATRKTVFSLILTESFMIAAVGAFLGIVFGHIVLYFGCEIIRAETGILLSAWYISPADLLAIPCAVILGLVTGFIPAIQAYRIGVLKNLVPVS